MYLQHTIKITGGELNKAAAHELIERAGITAEEQHHRGVWTRSKLTSNNIHVGWIEANRWPNGQPLHIIIDLNTLRWADENWQCTLETLGVLK